MGLIISCVTPAVVPRKGSTRCASSTATSKHCDTTSLSRLRIPKHLHSGKRPRRLLAWGARPPCLASHFRSVARKDFEQVVLAVLLGEEKHRPVFLEGLLSDQSIDRTVSLRHVQPRRLIVFLASRACDSVQAERDKTRYDVSLRMLSIQFVSPNRIELIQLIVQRVAAIFCHQDR